MAINKHNSNLLRAIYLDSGLTYKKIAEITGFKYNTIASWLSGRREPPDEIMQEIMRKIRIEASRKREE